MHVQSSHPFLVSESHLVHRVGIVRCHLTPVHPQSDWRGTQPDDIGIQRDLRSYVGSQPLLLVP